MQLEFNPFFVWKESFRHHLRVLLAFAGFCGGLAIAAFTPPHGWSDPLSALFVGLLFGVPGGLVLYPVYRVLRFALRR